MNSIVRGGGLPVWYVGTRNIVFADRYAQASGYEKN